MPKDNITDDILVKNVREKLCNDSLLTLCEKYDKIYFGVCAKYVKKVPYLKYEELIEDRFLVMNKAAQTFNNQRKTKFSTWLGYISRYHCLKVIRDNTSSGINYTECNNEMWDSILNSQSHCYHDDNSFIKEFIGQTLSRMRDKRILKIYKMRYLESNKEWKDIAEKFNLTKTYVKCLHDIGRDFIKKEMDKENASRK